MASKSSSLKIVWEARKSEDLSCGAHLRGRSLPSSPPASAAAFTETPGLLRNVGIPWAPSMAGWKLLVGLNSYSSGEMASLGASTDLTAEPCSPSEAPLLSPALS